MLPLPPRHAFPSPIAAWQKLPQLPPTQGEQIKATAPGAFFMGASESKTYYKVDIVSNTK